MGKKFKSWCYYTMEKKKVNQVTHEWAWACLTIKWVKCEYLILFGNKLKLNLHSRSK